MECEILWDGIEGASVHSTENSIMMSVNDHAPVDCACFSFDISLCLDR